MIPIRKLHRTLGLRTLPSVIAFVFMFTILYHLPHDARVPRKAYVAHEAYVHHVAHEAQGHHVSREAHVPHVPHFPQQRRYVENVSLQTNQNLITKDVLKTRDLSWLVTPQDFFRRLQGSEDLVSCKRLKALGGSSCHRLIDGHKQLCLDEDVYLDPRNCTVYSFGVADEISFDSAISRYGCQVFLLDPTLPPDAYEYLGPKMKFYPYGIFSDNKVIPMNLTHYAEWQGQINSTLLTYENLQQKLGRLHPPDYLKLDIEGAEWHVLPHMMDRNQLAGIKQLAVEIHINASAFASPGVTDYLRHLWMILERLQAQGFQKVYYEPTRSYESLYIVPDTNITFNTCGELFLIRRNLTEYSF
ncbi:Methyltransferase domain [Trinorchestia longiramus]|nr:Methyltransferase domain [Trinorchestia longiramus]